jgi:hypothetical protein
LSSNKTEGTVIKNEEDKTKVDVETKRENPPKELKVIKEEIVAVVANEGQKHKTTIKTEDNVEDPKQLRKIPGVKRDTVNGKLLETSINFPGKKNVACLDPGVDFSSAGAFLSVVVLQRLLWRVCMV